MKESFEYIVSEFSVRIRKTTWAPDVFVIVEREEFVAFHSICTMLNITLTEIES